jgi:hypothetical protein
VALEKMGLKIDSFSMDWSTLAELEAESAYFRDKVEMKVEFGAIRPDPKYTHAIMGIPVKILETK